jgi:hypothetical protein
VERVPTITKWDAVDFAKRIPLQSPRSNLNPWNRAELELGAPSTKWDAVERVPTRGGLMSRVVAEGVEGGLCAEVEVVSGEGRGGEDAFAEFGLVEDFGFLAAGLNHGEFSGD